MKNCIWIRGAVVMLLSACAASSTAVTIGQDELATAGGAIEVKNRLQLVQESPEGKSNLIFKLADDPAAPVPASEYWLGVQVATLPEVAKKQLAIEDGLAVEEVTPDSPAAKSDIKRYDILIKAGDAPLKSIADLVKAVDASQGKEIIITIVRDGKNQTIKVIADKRPKSEGIEAVKRKIAATRPELAAEIKQLEEALEKLKSKADKDGVGFWFAKPAVVAPRVDVRIPDGKLSETIIKSIKSGEFPKDLSVQINKEGGQPARIHVKRGDKEWDVTEEKLSELPGEIRQHVDQMLGKAVAAYRGIRISPEGKVEGDLKIAPLPPKPPVPPKAPLPPQASTAPKQLLQNNRVVTARAIRADSDTDSKLDAIIKKLDERSESIDNLDKKVEELKKEIDRFKERRG